MSWFYESHSQLLLLDLNIIESTIKRELVDFGAKVDKTIHFFLSQFFTDKGSDILIVARISRGVLYFPSLLNHFFDVFFVSFLVIVLHLSNNYNSHVSIHLYLVQFKSLNTGYILVKNLTTRRTWGSLDHHTNTQKIPQ